MKYKITITNLGRDKVTITATRDDEPDQDFLCRMARKHLMSSEIECLAESDEYPMKGIVVVGGFRPVGDVLIEKVGETHV